MRRTEIAKATLSTSITWDDEEVAIRWAPAAMTGNALADLEASEGTLGLAVFLASVLRGWDVLEDDGSETTITSESLMGLPVTFLAAVSKAVQTDMEGESGAGPTRAGN